MLEVTADLYKKLLTSLVHVLNLFRHGKAGSGTERKASHCCEHAWKIGWPHQNRNKLFIIKNALSSKLKDSNFLLTRMLLDVFTIDDVRFLTRRIVCWKTTSVKIFRRFSSFFQRSDKLFFSAQLSHNPSKTSKKLLSTNRSSSATPLSKKINTPKLIHN